MSRTVQITFDAHDPRALSCFWRDALGYVHPGPPGVALAEGADPLAAWDEFLARIGVPADERNTRSAIEDPDGPGPRLCFQQVPEGKTAKNRVHLDVRAAPGLHGEERMAALEAECARLVALGATRLHRHDPAPPLDAGHIVLADPEGNELCLDRASVQAVRPDAHDPGLPGGVQVREVLRRGRRHRDDGRRRSGQPAQGRSCAEGGGEDTSHLGSWAVRADRQARTSPGERQPTSAARLGD